MQKNPDPGSVISKRYFFWLTLAVILIDIGDEMLKLLAVRSLPDEAILTGPKFLTLAVHRNYGLIFDIPFRMPIIVVISLCVAVILARIMVINWKNNTKVSFLALLIIIGAAGNLFDRIFYGFTVDYILISGRLAINISDILIVLGVAGLLFATRRNKFSEQLDKAA
jgi:lipoprotein signal peptidase